MRCPLALLVLLAAGCGSADPATSRLAAGTKVIVPQSTSALLVDLDGNRFPERRFGGALSDALRPGDEATVEDDPGGDGERLVKILVTKQFFYPDLKPANLIGLECRTRRLDLRPIP